VEYSGAQIVVECLRREGVTHVFGYPGGVNLPIFDVFYDEKEIRLVLCRHEQGGGHMAEGYARATGRPGVLLVTSGPGATNTVTAIADAFMDSTPMVILTGQVPTHLIGNDAFQEADVVGITRPCTKYNILVKDVADLAQTIKEAFYIASSGRPGPVLVDIPKDVFQAKTEFRYPDKVSLRSYSPVLKGNKWQIRQAAQEISKASRPVIYSGGGVLHSSAWTELRELAGITRIPVTSTVMGLGAFPGRHPLFLGMLGMHGTYCANMAMHEADLIIAIGARFDDRVTGKPSLFAPHARIIHIDIDPTSIHKNIKVHVPIVGDVKQVLKELNDVLRTTDNGSRVSLRAWTDQIEEWRTEHPLGYDPGPILKPQYVIERIFERTGGNAIVTTDVGQHQMWSAQYYKFDRPRTFINSGGLGTMGYGLPAAIGAQFAYPAEQVVCITGDGSVIMNIQELATAVEENIPIKVAIINNGYLGMVRQWQQIFYKGRYSASFMGGSPDFVKLAEAFGAVGLRATSASEVDNILDQAFRIDRPVVMDFRVDAMENCYPMIAPGAGHHEMFFKDPEPVDQKDSEGNVEKAEEVLTA
jgi:acetolactate synthase-1/2/3 large subunit